MENNELRQKVTNLAMEFNKIVNDVSLNFYDCQRIIDEVSGLYFQAIDEGNEEIQSFLASTVIELKSKRILSNRIANSIDEETFDKEKQSIEWWKIEKKKSELNFQISTQFSKVSDSYIKQLQSDFEDLEEQQKEMYSEGKIL